MIRNSWLAVFSAVMCLIAAGVLPEQSAGGESASAAREAHGATARVLRVLPGCLLEVEGPEVSGVLRLRGVVSPREQNPTRELIYEKAAEQFLEKFVGSGSVRIQGLGKPDARQVRDAYLYRGKDRLFVNFHIIRMGFGHAALETSHDFSRLFQDGERDARMQGAGLWGRKPPEKRRFPDGVRGFHDGARIYLTMIDKKYHRDYCWQLRQERFPMAFGKALAAGYEACPFCIPGAEKVSAGKKQPDQSGKTGRQHQ